MSAFAGQEVNLRFEFRQNSLNAYPGYDGPGQMTVIDDISFAPIPEPSPLALLGVGGLLLLRFRGRQARASHHDCEGTPACH